MFSARWSRRTRCSFLITLLFASIAAVAPSWAGPPPAVTVQYQLQPEFTGTAKAGGRIVVSLTNHSGHALTEVTVRLADATLGRVTGPVQESFALAAGETRTLEGDFVLDTKVLNPSHPLDWIVMATEPEGFAQQSVVRGVFAPGATMDADVHTKAN